MLKLIKLKEKVLTLVNDEDTRNLIKLEFEEIENQIKNLNQKIIKFESEFVEVEK